MLETHFCFSAVLQGTGNGFFFTVQHWRDPTSALRSNYAAQVQRGRALHLKKGLDKLEQVCRRATKIIRCLENRTNEERL